MLRNLAIAFLTLTPVAAFADFPANAKICVLSMYSSSSGSMHYSCDGSKNQDLPITIVQDGPETIPPMYAFSPTFTANAKLLYDIGMKLVSCGSKGEGNLFCIFAR
jgi:hypothetical protein